MRRFAVLSIVVLGVCATAGAEETILPLMLEKSDIVAHVKVLEIVGGVVDEEEVVEWYALAEVVTPIKGGLAKGEKVRFHLDQFKLAGHTEPLAAEKGKEYVIFLAGKSDGGAQFPGDAKTETHYRLIDRWVGVLPHQPSMVRKLEQSLRAPAKPADADRRPGILPVMLEKSDIVAHVKILKVSGGFSREAGVVGRHTSCEIITSVKGELKPGTRYEFFFTQIGFPGERAALIVQDGGEYLVFVRGDSLIDNWVGALPAEHHLFRRLSELQEVATKQPPYFGLPASTQSLHSGRFDVRLKLSRFGVVRGEEILVTVTVSPLGERPEPLDMNDFARYLDVCLYGVFGYMGPEKILPAKWTQDGRPAAGVVTITRDKPLDLSFRLSDALSLYPPEGFTLGWQSLKVRLFASKPEGDRSQVAPGEQGAAFPRELGSVKFMVLMPAKEDIDEMSRVARAFMYAKSDKDLAEVACPEVHVCLRLQPLVWRTFSVDAFAKLMHAKDLPRRQQDESPTQFGYSETKRGIFFTTKGRVSDVLRFRKLDGKWRVSELSLYD